MTCCASVPTSAAPHHTPHHTPHTITHTTTLSPAQPTPPTLNTYNPIPSTPVTPAANTHTTITTPATHLSLHCNTSLTRNRLMMMKTKTFVRKDYRTIATVLKRWKNTLFITRKAINLSSVYVLIPFYAPK
ncbi:hypothetical protein E2C01_003254 [Portunus trituberculatus]|uniref:Uncharacterized protein n=1 Tax=Portunus trituberculatus TaxID=210409 RepID=A0A5B7CLX8_PORTR|nr:hypothetical protein [Portunus trituberculatus]